MKRTLPVLLSMLFVALLTTLAGCDPFAAAREREQQAEIEKLRAEKAQAQEEARRLEAQLKELQAKIDVLLEQLANAKDEAIRADLQKQLAAERARAGKSSASGKSDCKCVKSDPLCTCL